MTMYSLFLAGVQFPIAPSAISLKINNKNETITLINEGEVNFLKKPGLTDVEFEVLLPNSQYPFAVYPNSYKPAAFYLELLESLKVGGKPNQFIITRSKPDGTLLFDTNITVSVEDYTIDEDAEEGFDIKCTINLKQFKPFGNKKLILKQSTAVNGGAQKTTATVEKKRDTSSKKSAKTYKVQKGDTLWAIAKKHLGAGTKANIDKLAKSNNIKDPNRIYVGQVLKLE